MISRKNLFYRVAALFTVAAVMFAQAGTAYGAEGRLDFDVSGFLKDNGSTTEYSSFSGDMKSSGELIIKYKGQGDSPEALSQEKSSRKFNYKTLKQIGENMELVQVAPYQSLESAIAELEKNPAVEYVQPNYILNAYEIPNDPLYARQWGMSNNGQLINGGYGTTGVDINIQKAWSMTKGNSEIIVGVLDSGIDINHPDIRNNIVAGWDFAHDDSSVYDKGDDESHGTNIAGIIAASINNNTGVSGVAPNVKIMPLKFMINRSGYTADAIEAINYAKARGVKIINCSFGGDRSDLALRDAMEASDILFVCAAGNNGRNLDMRPCYPACFGLSNQINVAAVDNDGNLCSFSNYGREIDVAAPGQDIFNILPENSYGYMSGTSMAAPFVTGVAALMKSLAPADNPDRIVEEIKAGCLKMNNLQSKVNTGGMVDSYKAVQNADNIKTESGIPLISSQDVGICPADAIIDDVRPEIYVASFGEKKLYAIDYDTGNYKEIRVEANPGCIAYANGKLYVGMQSPVMSVPTGSIAVVDADSFKLIDRFDIGMVPDDIAADEDGFIYVTGRTDGGYEIKSYSESTKAQVSSVNMGQLNMIEIHPELKRIYSLNSYTSSDGFKMYPIQNGQLSGQVDGPPLDAEESYLGSYFKISPDGKYLFNSYGSIFKCHEDSSIDMSYVGSIGQSFYKIAFDLPNDRFYVSTGKTYVEYRYSSLERVGEYTAPRDITGLFSAGGSLLAIDQYEGNYYIDKLYPVEKPSDLQAVSIGSEIRVTWKGISGVTGYDVEVDGTSIDNGVSESYVISGAAPAASYLVKVRARKGKQVSDWAVEVQKAGANWAGSINMPSARADFAAVELEGKIYVIGGMNAFGEAMGTVEVFDPGTQTWSQAASLNIPRYGLEAETVNGKIYAVGGENSLLAYGTVEEYDPHTDTWTEKQGMQQPRSNFGLQAVDGKLYAMGGYGHIPVVKSLEQYDAAKDEWKVIGEMLTPRYGFSTAAIGDTIYTVSGVNEAGELAANVEAYHTGTNSWSREEDISVPRCNAGQAVAGGNLYIIGGNDSYSEVELVEAYDSEAKVWSSFDSLFTDRTALECIFLNNDIYALGGFSNSSHTVLSDVEKYTFVPAGMKIEGPDSISLPETGDVTQEYFAYSLDSHGNKIGRQSALWSVTGDRDAVSVNSDTGIVIVKSGTAGTSFVLGAVQAEVAAASAVKTINIVNDSIQVLHSAGFDKKPSLQADIVVPVNFRGNTISDIYNGNSTLIKDVHYTCTAGSITISKNYLVTLPNGTALLKFRFSAGRDSIFSISIVDSTPPPVTPPPVTPPPVTPPPGIVPPVPEAPSTTPPAVAATQPDAPGKAVKPGDKQGYQRLKAEIKALGKETVKPSVVKNTATLSLSEGVIKSLLTRADNVKKELKTAGLSSRDKVLLSKVTIETGLDGNIDFFKASLPAELLGTLGKKGISRIELTSSMGAVAIDTAEMFKKTASLITVELRRAGAIKDLTGVQKSAIGKNPVLDLKLFVVNSDGTRSEISSFSKPVEVRLPYLAKKGEDPEKITAYYLDEKGQTENMSGCYDSLTKTVVFTTMHFSKYFLKENKVSFSDLKGYEAYRKYIEVLAAKGIVGVDKGNNFNPGAGITRGELADMLVKEFIIGNIGAGALKNNYTDVKKSNRYYSAIALAAQAGLLGGGKDGKFRPDDRISRQEFAIIIANALKKYKGINSPGEVKQLSALKDYSKISTYARPSIALLVQNGIITIESGKAFNPSTAITKAEAAQILYKVFDL
ncbi:S8 family serine peptidase [Ruminiclostridium hungatei]|nr:S8 family serine peptidase [Ruminiclostridium hungatei]